MTAPVRLHSLVSPCPRVRLGRLAAGALLALGGVGVGFGQAAPAATPAAAAPAAPEQPADTSLEGMYKAAMEQFNGGNFAAAADGLKQVLDALPPEALKQREPLLFTLGAAYFNAKNYPSAIIAFNEFLAKFPSSEQFNEVTYALGQSQLLSGNTAAGQATLQKLESIPGMREQVLIFQAGSAKNAGNIPGAIAALEKLTSAGITSPATAKGGIQLASLYIEKGETDKAAKLLVTLQAGSQFVENIVLLDSLTLQLGDKLLTQQKYREALECFRRVRTKEDIVALQEQRIADMEERIERNLAENRRDPNTALKNLAANAQIRGDIETAKKQLAELQAQKPYLGPLYLRMAQAFSQERQLWEALVVYEELLKRVPEGSEREPAAFATVVGYAEADQPEAALEAAERYLKEFPNEKNAGIVRYVRSTTALQQRDFSKAEGWLEEMLTQSLEPELKEQIRILLGNAKFSQGQFDQAVEQYRRYLADFPEGRAREEAEYRAALALMFGGNFEDAIPAIEAYLKAHPEGEYASDAKYRLAVCWFAAQRYDEVIDRCKKWMEEYPNGSQFAEVASLLGDCYANQDGKVDEAIKAYQLSAERATSDEVLNYSLFEASKLLQRQGRWDEVSAMMEKFVADHPEHPTTLAALYWIGRAKAKEGKADEAKAFLADATKKHIDNPSKEAVEQILSQIAQLIAKRKPTRPVPVADGAAPAPTPAPVDPMAEVDQVLAFAKESPAARARVLYAKSEVGRNQKSPEKQQEFLGQIAENFKPADLSPMLLGQIGDYWVRQKDFDRAEPFYTYLYQNYPKSNFIDYAYAGLGDIALSRGQNDRALQYFTDGTEKIAANTKLRELTIGQAKALFALGNLEEARKIFEQVASTREWRGEATAESVYYLGEIQFKQEKWAEANAYYQRVFVTYRKFLDWVARSYLRSAESFVKLGKTPEAINTYNEMLRNDKLADLPETKVARQRLQELGQP